MKLLVTNSHKMYDSTPAETYYLHGIRGEKWGFHRTEVLEQYPFPEIPNHKFIAESIIWNRIGKQFLTRYINHPVRRVFTDGEDHLTRIQHYSSSSKPDFL